MKKRVSKLIHSKYPCASLSPSPTFSTSSISNILAVFTGKFNNCTANQEFQHKVSILRDHLLLCSADVERIEKVLQEKGVPLFSLYSDGSAVVELLHQLPKNPILAHQVFSWRRRQADYSALISSEEYTKGITIAGRLKNVDLAVELFKEARNKGIKSTNLYNALMSVYMYTGYSKKCQTLFLDLKREVVCRPTIVTYNILISLFGSNMLIDRMEETFQEMRDQNLFPDFKTYNNLITGYLTAWMWEPMEKTFQIMKASSVEPNLVTYKLMLRGYALSRQINKMEEIFKLVVDHITYRDSALIGCMLFAYYKSSDVNKVNKVEELLMRMPQGDHRHWLNVMLITLYAKEGMVEKMESAINQAFEQNTCVTTEFTMRCIINNYFRSNVVDRLAEFVKRAETAGWKIIRSLYHCKMVMYSAQGRLPEMEGVLDEMDKQNMGCSKRTFWILYKAYKQWDKENRLHQVLGIMCTRGFGIPLNRPTDHDLIDI